MEVSNSAVRYHYMDNLRALAMMLGIFFHAALAYSPFMGELWLSADPENLLPLDYIAWFTHLFRMPLFFLIAGFFSHHLICRRGVRGFVINRVRRIALPFVIFLPLVILALLGVVYYASFVLGVHTALLDFVMTAIKIWPNGDAHFSTSHLWFLYNLLWFYAVAALLYRFAPWAISRHRLFRSPIFVLCVLPFTLVPALLGQMTPFPAPERLVPEFWAFGFFGVYFFLGWVFYKNKEWLLIIERYWLPVTVVCLLAYVVYYPHIPKEITIKQALFQINNRQVLTLSGLVTALAAAFTGLYATFICLFVGYKLLNRESIALRFMADSSYWVYIIHLPLLLFIQVHLIHLQWPLLIKFGVGAFGTVLAGVTSYAMLVRGKPIGRMLNGR